MKVLIFMEKHQSYLGLWRKPNLAVKHVVMVN